MMAVMAREVGERSAGGNDDRSVGSTTVSRKFGHLTRNESIRVPLTGGTTTSGCRSPLLPPLSLFRSVSPSSSSYTHSTPARCENPRFLFRTRRTERGLFSQAVGGVRGGSKGNALVFPTLGTLRLLGPVPLTSVNAQARLGLSLSLSACLRGVPITWRHYFPVEGKRAFLSPLSPPLLEWKFSSSLPSNR